MRNREKSKSYQILKTRYYKAIDSPNAIGIYVGDLHPNKDVLEFIEYVNTVATSKQNKKLTRYIFKELVTQKTGFGCPTGYLYFKEG